MDLKMVLFTLVVNSSNLLSRPLYELNDDFVDFSNGLVHFTKSSTLWTGFVYFIW